MCVPVSVCLFGCLNVCLCLFRFPACSSTSVVFYVRVFVCLFVCLLSSCVCLSVWCTAYRETLSLSGRIPGYSLCNLSIDYEKSLAVHILGNICDISDDGCWGCGSGWRGGGWWGGGVVVLEALGKGEMRIRYHGKIIGFYEIC